jgi:hypothetical protein
MLKKLLLSTAFVAILGTFGFAQTGEDYHKGEVFAGYSNNQVDTGANNQNGTAAQNFFNNRESFNGFEVSGVGNFSRYVGVKGSFSGHYKDFNLTVPTVGTTPSARFKVNGELYNFLGGVQVKDNAKEGSRVRPFGHAMIGAAHAKAEIDSSFFNSTFCQQVGTNCRGFIDSDSSDTGFSAALGGGLDIKASNRVSIRAFQVDYNPNRFNGSTDHNFRFGFGVVIH